MNKKIEVLKNTIILEGLRKEIHSLLWNIKNFAEDAGKENLVACNSCLEEISNLIQDIQIIQQEIKRYEMTKGSL